MQTGRLEDAYEITVEAGKTSDGPVVVIRSGCFGCVLSISEAEEFKKGIDQAIDRAFGFLSEDMDGEGRWTEKRVEV